MEAAEKELLRLYEKALKELTNEIEARESSGKSIAYQKRLLKKIKQIISNLKKQTPELVRQMTSNAYYAGLQSAMQDVTAQLGYALEPTVNMRALQILQQNATDQLLSAVNRVGRIWQDAIRNMSIDATIHKFSTGQTINDMRRNLLEQLIQSGKPSAGGMRLDAYAKLVARSTTAETQNASKLNAAEQYGYDLADFTQHTPTCAICAQYEGRVFALTKEAANGKYKGPNGEPLHFPYIYDTAFISGYNNIHPNCKHRLTLLVPSLLTPEQLAEMSRKSMQPFVDTRTESVRRAYAKTQEENRARWQDRRQWEKYREIMPDQTPKTFAAFRKMKNSGGELLYFMALDFKRQKRLINNPKLALPYADHVTAASTKFTEYLFNPQNADGYAKGIAISKRLGYNIENWNELRDLIIDAAKRYPVAEKVTDQYGTRYEQKIILYGTKGTPANVKIGWITKASHTKLTTCFIEEV